jgi:hypothetical protein
MPISAQVWTLPDEKLAYCTHSSIGEIIRAARKMDMPMLGNVDQYDDTRFNRMQMKLVSSELLMLASTQSGDGLDAVEELLALVELVKERPHRYLVFVGD